MHPPCLPLAVSAERMPRASQAYLHHRLCVRTWRPPGGSTQTSRVKSDTCSTSFWSYPRPGLWAWNSLPVDGLQALPPASSLNEPQGVSICSGFLPLCPRPPSTQLLQLDPQHCGPSAPRTPCPLTDGSYILYLSASPHAQGPCKRLCFLPHPDPPPPVTT